MVGRALLALRRIYQKILSALRQFLFPKTVRNVLFFRNFISFQGGHLKVWNYYQYLNKLSAYTPKIFFSKKSVWDRNPWLGNCVPEKEWRPNSADILFLAGVDWVRLEGIELDEKIPVINLIQGLRHADPSDRRFQYLSQKAIRICVSKEVADALKKTKQVNGPIYTVPNGIDLSLIQHVITATREGSNKQKDVLISGLKNHDFAKKIEARLREMGLFVETLYDGIPRKLYLEKIAEAKVSIFLPRTKEGFYLPAIESMALGTLVICPDCIGNRSFCKDNINCFMPKYEIEFIVEKTRLAMTMDNLKYAEMIKQGKQTSRHYSLAEEEQSFLEIMKKIDQIW